MPVRGRMQDLRLAFRSLRATPIVTLVAILSLALGIGANTAIFSLVDNLVLKDLPVNNPARLYLLSMQGASLPPPQFSAATVRELRRIGAFDGVAGWTNCCGRSIVQPVNARATAITSSCVYPPSTPSVCSSSSSRP